MGRGEKEAYVRAVWPRYMKANRVKKSVILDEMTATLGMHRKAVIRMLHRAFEPSKAKDNPLRQGRGRPSFVTESDRMILKRLLSLCDYPCAKRLIAMLPLWIDYDEEAYGVYEPFQKERILSLSAATVDRHLAPIRKALGIKGKCGTKPGTLLREHIPIRSGPWDVSVPGYLEADTVAHCGYCMKGAFAWSLTLTDIHSTWTECRAVWNKSSQHIVKAMQDIDEHLPFTIKGIDCDNGSEFLNHTLIKHFQAHPAKPTFTRCRPYKKNDQAHVEQKNWTHVRQLWGYQRIDNRSLVDEMNDLYRNEVSWMNNFFTPCRKLKSKLRLGSKIIKRYEVAKTPLQRLLDDTVISQETKTRLKEKAHSLNPIALRATIRDKIKAISAQASVTPIMRQPTNAR